MRGVFRKRSGLAATAATLLTPLGACDLPPSSGLVAFDAGGSGGGAGDGSDAGTQAPGEVQTGYIGNGSNRAHR